MNTAKRPTFDENVRACTERLRAYLATLYQRHRCSSVLLALEECIVRGLLTFVRAGAWKPGEALRVFEKMKAKVARGANSNRYITLSTAGERANFTDDEDRSQAAFELAEESLRLIETFDPAVLLEAAVDCWCDGAGYIVRFCAGDEELVYGKVDTLRREYSRRLREEEHEIDLPRLLTRCGLNGLAPLRERNSQRNARSVASGRGRTSRKFPS